MIEVSSLSEEIYSRLTDLSWTPLLGLAICTLAVFTSTKHRLYWWKYSLYSPFLPVPSIPTFGLGSASSMSI